MVYESARGVPLPLSVGDLDIVLPTKTPQGYLFPSPVGSGTKINPNFGVVGGNLYRGDSVYDALELGVQKALSHGVQLQGSFTWGTGIDTSSAAGSPDQFSNSISTLPWYDLRSARGLSDFNIGRTLVISGTWQLPSASAFSGTAWR